MKLKIFTFQQYLWHAFGTMVVSLLFCLLVNVVLNYSSGILDPISQAMNKISMTDTYFNVENKDEDAVIDYNPDIVMLDLAGCYSRAAIAHRLEEVHKYHPKTVALDVIFGGIVDANKEESDSLQHVINKMPEIIAGKRVVADADGYHTEHSFFVDQAHCDEACVNVTKDADIIRNYADSIDFGDYKEQTFVSKILEKSYPTAYKKLHTAKNDPLINFKGLAVTAIAFNDTIYPDDIKDKVVLVGDFEDLRDFHDVPPVVGGSRRINGTYIHAYAITTATQRSLYHMSDTAGLILGLVISYLFAIVCCIIFVELDSLSGLITSFFQLLALFLFTILGGVVFIGKGIEINLATAIAGIAILATTTEIWFWLCTTKPYRKVQEYLHLPDGGVRRYVEITGKDKDDEEEEENEEKKENETAPVETKEGEKPEEDNNKSVESDTPADQTNTEKHEE